ncbi:MAG TPA: cupin domain-containing protein [Segeticoccus sp.]|nr:cupin domain-containing protein [Segeticoccus sp.]
METALRSPSAALEAASLDEPHEVRRFPRGHMEVVRVCGHAVARVTFAPGWRWSADVRPAAGTRSCEVTHTGVVLAGRLAVRMDDGIEAVAGPGDVVRVPPGHDGWVVGDDACVMLDWTGADDYAR